MGTLIQDVRYASRTLRRAPGFLVTALLTLSIAIGANTAIFSVIKAVLLRPFDYPNLERIILLWGVDPRTENVRGQVSATEVEDIRRQSGTLESIATFSDWYPTLSGVGESERIPATQVGNGFFDVMGVRPFLGRAFTPSEQLDGQDRVVILSYNLWRNRFHSDPNIIGRAITLSTVPHIVIGVMPASFRPLPSNLVEGGQLYRPVAEPYDVNERSSRHLRAIARLKRGAAISSAQAEITAISERLTKEDPRHFSNIGKRVVSLFEDSVSKLRVTLYLLSGAVMLLLLIACANVANLLLSRSAVRQREMAVRTALGASRGRLIWQVLTESLLLSFIAGVIGLFVAYWGTRGLALAGSKVSSQIGLASVNGPVMMFCLVTAFVTGILFGLAPISQLAHISVSEALKSSARGASLGHSRLRNSLVVTEVAMAVVMLICAGLLVRSFYQLLNVDPGFETKGRLAVNVWLPFSKYSKAEQQIPFYRQLLERLDHIPGIQAAGIVSNPPMGNFDGRVFTTEGQRVSIEEMPEAQFYMVSSRYFETMGISRVLGRSFNDSDTESSQPVVIVNKKLAGTRFPGQNAIGRRIQVQSGLKENGQFLWRTIVGVVANVKQHGLDQPAVEQIYVPFVQMPVTWMTLVVHADGNPLQAVTPVRSIVKGIDSDVAPFAISTYGTILGNTIAIRKFALWLVTAFGALALLLGIVGIYGVISYSVTQRTQEIGIRMALGAQRSNILSSVLSDGLRFTIVGIVIGSVGALASTRFLQSLLYQVQPTDLSTFVSIAVLILICAVGACLIPAKRATSVDPMAALRYE